MNEKYSSDSLSAYHTRESLLIRLKVGQDESAWDEFHALYGRLIFGYSLHFNLSYSEAEDVVQEVCIKVFRQIGRFDYSKKKGRFRGWLKVITRNTVIDYLRRKQLRIRTSDQYREHLESLVESERAMDDQIWRKEWEKALYETAIENVRKRIGEDTFKTFKLYVLDQRPAKDVAEETTLDANAIYAVRHRVLKFLREEVANIINDN